MKHYSLREAATFSGYTYTTLQEMHVKGYIRSQKNRYGRVFVDEREIKRLKALKDNWEEYRKARNKYYATKHELWAQQHAVSLFDELADEPLHKTGDVLSALD